MNFYNTPPPELCYTNDYWTALSDWYRTEQNWICEACGIDLQERKEFLDTHHVRGRGYNSPDDLKALCVKCHSDQTEPSDHSFMKEGSKYRQFMQSIMRNIKEAFKEQIGNESRILRLDPTGGRFGFIDYRCGSYTRSEIRLSIWIGKNLDIIAANLLIGNEFLGIFRELEERRNTIQRLFPEDEIHYQFREHLRKHRIGIRKNIDLHQRSSWNETAIWARESLEKFFYIISIHDRLVP